MAARPSLLAQVHAASDDLGRATGIGAMAVLSTWHLDGPREVLTARTARFLHVDHECQPEARRRRLAPTGQQMPRRYGSPDRPERAGHTRPLRWRSRRAVASHRALDVGRTELAVLSACDTAASTLAASDAINLASMTLMAGARQVVASLWPVDDEATLYTMVEMHRGLIAGDRPADALVAAQRTVRSLDRATALLLLDAWRQDIDGAEAIIDPIGLAQRWQRRAADQRPFAGFDAWAPFLCFGPPRQATT